MIDFSSIHKVESFLYVRVWPDSSYQIEEDEFVESWRGDDYIVVDLYDYDACNKLQDLGYKMDEIAHEVLGID